MNIRNVGYSDFYEKKRSIIAIPFITLFTVIHTRLRKIEMEVKTIKCRNGVAMVPGSILVLRVVTVQLVRFLAITTIGIEGLWPFIRKKEHEPVSSPSVFPLVEPPNSFDHNSMIRVDILGSFYVTVRYTYSSYPMEDAHCAIEREVRKLGTQANLVLYLDGGSSEEKRPAQVHQLCESCYGARDSGYIMVGVNEYSTSKKCPTYEKFVGQVEIRRLYCSTCKS
ncbi:hypothetical protein BC939DRAFT_474078 [Gamsiella multidivaricata]|uniref:uncharacterized protein n=1 Tax=Gamsiella multidivaricata TaxID=101098 RepID=UPI0022205B77|nr:uncharacterized protein BC939DRAFT_474078 [Gamsiella multidivaricata]KAI7829511.1 hypothetical protein BC939DRAFT_474078 [Gamsiella multidivaricata]